MWSKIKSLPIPISVKLTSLYTLILFCILLLTSLLTITGLRHFLSVHAEQELDDSVNNVTRYLIAGRPIDQHLLKENLLAPEVTLSIFDDQGNLLLTSTPYLTNSLISSKEEEEHNKPRHPKAPPHGKRFLQKTSSEEKYYVQQLTWQGDRIYQLQFIRTMSLQSSFLKVLIDNMIVTNLIGLFIAIISGIFISRKILHPIRDMIQTAKEIEINDLSKRIAVNGSDDELQKLAKTFNHMLNRIQKGFEQQQQFVGDASHELRTPITIISGYADMLDRWGKQDPAALNEGISAIKSEAASMHGLIEKLLFLAKSDRGKQLLNKVPVPMEDLIEKVFQETLLIALDHQVVLTRNDVSIISCDAAAIKQMLRIFIENSVKYTPSGGTIRIHSEQTKTHLNITIQDTGIGISEEEQPKIFNRFYRVDKSRSKITGGTGLGLSIAQWIAEQHHSTIEVESTFGTGTTTTVKIPLLSSNSTN